MFKALANWFLESALWNWMQIGYLVIVIFTVAMFIWQQINTNPKKYLRFIAKATEEGCVAIGKLTCLTLHGVNKPEYFQAEYMYVVNDKRYFVTYKMWYSIPVDERRDEMNADMVLLQLKGAMPLFYDKKDPSKVVSKIEVFTSDEGIKQIYTPKDNSWRDTEREWESPIDLVHYSLNF